MFIEKNDQPVPYFKSSPMMRISLVFCLAGIVAVGFASGIFERLLSISGGLSILP
jgi:hypothetical protein